MIKKIIPLFISAALFACADEKSQPVDIADPQIQAKTEVQKPNILLITVDDLGYTDLGIYGSEIATPNIDALAKEGVLLTNFHTAPTCSPTRSMLMSGTDNHLAGLGTMEEYLHVHPELAENPGYEGYLNERVAPLPELMRDAGYRTYITGKWHLGKGENASPAAKGFDKSFVLLDGGAGHFDDLGIMPFEPTATYREDGKIAQWPEGVYSTKFYTEKLINYIAEDKASDKPFFAFLSYTAPHWPIQAPEKSIEKYKGRYDQGYEALFQERLAKQKALGLIDENIVGQALQKGQLAWNKLTAEEKRISSKKMEIYAAMIDDVDIYIGRVIEFLKASGQYENTVIFFMSDNGAQAGEGFAGIDEYIAKCCDNSYENMGKVGSYLYTGPNWARASTGQSRLYKSSTTEGGILAPAFISYPNSAVKGARYGEFVSVMDLLPTFLQFSQTQHPGTTYKGREVYPLKGKSMASILTNVNEKIHADDYVMGWELFGHKAIRQGDWKIVLTQPPLGEAKWQLFNVKEDPTELNDLSKQAPDKFKAMLAQWHKYQQDNGVVAQ